MPSLRRLFTLAVFLLFISCASGIAAAQTKGAEAGKLPAKADDIEEIAEVQAVEVSSRPAFPDLVGRLHPVVIHFPIAWIFLLVLVEAAALAAGRPDWSNAGWLISILALASIPPAMITGFLRAEHLGTNPEFLELMVPHRNLNIAASAVFVAAFLIRVRRRENLAGAARGLYLFLTAISFLLLSAGSHFGGKMVFGRNFLPF